VLSKAGVSVSSDGLLSGVPWETGVVRMIGLEWNLRSRAGFWNVPGHRRW